MKGLNPFQGISGVPVLNHEGETVGVITKTDLFRVMISLTGVGQRGIQFAFQLEEEFMKKATLLYMVDHRENVGKIY